MTETTKTDADTTDTGSARTVPADADASGAKVDPPAEAPRANREARYRVERNEAREMIKTLLDREVLRIAREHLAQAEDVRMSAHELSDFLDEHGYVDPEKVAEACAEVIADRPGLRKGAGVNAPVTDPMQGLGGRGHGVTWTDFLRP